MVVGSNGYCMVAGSCFVSGCAQCVPNNNWQCQTCLNGYWLTNVMGCTRKPKNGAAGVPSLAVAAVSAAVTCVGALLLVL
jgi:hypothetical protein